MLSRPARFSHMRDPTMQDGLLEKVKTHTDSTIDVCYKLGVSASTLSRWVKTRKGFPQPIRLSPRMLRYDISAIEKYLSSEEV